ncbi:MFS transporter [Pengzhenrongella sp.]|uniref:MFS transporter n=1 Tax=Pengzhenrongella sp. TaxID=2888820 RepID=UPI002F937081
MRRTSPDLLLTLVVAGRAADRFGRKPVLIPGLLVALTACVLFMSASSVVVLVIARFLTGVAVGVVVSAGMAAVVDLGGPDRRRQASLAASVAMVLGAGLGPLLAGLIAQETAEPVVPIFAVELVLLLGALVIAYRLPIPRPSPRQPSTRQVTGSGLHLPSVPRPNQNQVALGIAAFAPGITATSFVLSLGPSLLSTLLGVSSPLIAGGTACVMFVTATAVQLAVPRLPARSILILSTGATLASMIALVVAVNGSLAVPLVVAAVLAGAGQGLGQLGGLSLIGTHVPSNRRAEANSVLNIGGYVPAGVLAVLIGYLIDAVGLARGATLFAAILALAAIAGGALISTSPEVAAEADTHPGLMSRARGRTVK